MPRPRLSLEQYRDGVLGGDRQVLARAITLVESTRADDAALAAQLLQALLPCTGGAWRVGITGVPGAGKSTLIDRLGVLLLGRGHRVAVLAVDPSSALSGGSILGDKTRMEALGADPRAFVRPSPAGRTLGGVARRTRETLLLCEAAGFDVVLIETVGVGQSETAVAEMVDCFITLLIPGGGDELQGIKKGLIELTDLLVINKADGDQAGPAAAAAREYTAALRYLRPRHRCWRARALLASGLTGQGLPELWAAVGEHRAAMQQSGELAALRREQRGRWLWGAVEEQLLEDLLRDPAVQAALPAVEAQVLDGVLPPGAAAAALLARRGAPG